MSCRAPSGLVGQESYENYLFGQRSRAWLGEQARLATLFFELYLREELDIPFEATFKQISYIWDYNIN